MFLKFQKKKKKVLKDDRLGTWKSLWHICVLVCMCVHVCVNALFPFDNTDFLLMSKSAFLAAQNVLWKGKEKKVCCVTKETVFFFF